MLAPLTLEPIALAARSVHRIENAKGVRVSCVRGATWITQERDQRDMILAAGQSFVLDRPGLAVVYAFKDAVITVGSGLAAAASPQPAGTACEAERAAPEARHAEGRAMTYQIHRYPAELIDVVRLRRRPARRGAAGAAAGRGPDRRVLPRPVGAGPLRPVHDQPCASCRRS